MSMLPMPNRFPPQNGMPPPGMPPAPQMQPPMQPMPPVPQQGVPTQNLPPTQLAVPPAPYVPPPLLSEKEFSDLKGKIAVSYKELEPNRAFRKKAKAQYVGDSFGMTGPDQRYQTIVNMLDQMVEVYMQQLVSGNPQVLVITQKMAMRTSVRYFQLALNHVINQINIRDALKFAVLESLFSPLCAVKVGVDKPSESDRQYPFDVSAMPFVEPIFFNDWVHDTSVERWELCRFYGDRYMEHIDTIKADVRNDPEILKNLDTAQDDSVYGEMQDSTSDRQNKNPLYDSDKKDMVPLWDIYMPRKRVLVTYLANGENTKPLRMVKWDGPPEGPYYITRYKLVPNEIMAKPPVADILNLADIHNKQWLKLSKQAQREKTVGMARPADAKDAKKVIESTDGEVIAVQNPESVRELRFGGASQEGLTFTQVAKQEASYSAGNLDTMGGLSSQAETLGQEKMLAESSSGRIRARQQSVIELTKSVMWAVGWYLWNDPLVRVSVTDKIPGTDVEMEAQWPIQKDEYDREVDLRQGEYNDLNIDLEPWSMKDKSPGEIAQTLMQIVQTQVIPMIPLLQPQGVQFDAKGYFDNLADLTGIHQLKDMLVDASEPPDPGDNPANMGGTKSPQTTRTYDSRSTKGGGQDSQAEMISSMPKTNTGSAA